MMEGQINKYEDELEKMLSSNAKQLEIENNKLKNNLENKNNELVNLKNKLNNLDNNLKDKNNKLQEYDNNKKNLVKEITNLINKLQNIEKTSKIQNIPMNGILKKVELIKKPELINIEDRLTGGGKNKSLNKMNRNELNKIAKNWGIKNYSKYKNKNDLKLSLNLLSTYKLLGGSNIKRNILNKIAEHLDVDYKQYKKKENLNKIIKDITNKI